MRKLFLLLSIIYVFSCDGFPKKKSLEQMKAENKAKLDSLNTEKRANTFKDIDSNELIGKTLKTKYFYFLSKEGLISGDTIYSNSSEFPTQSKFKLNRKSIIYSEGGSQTIWNGSWIDNIFIREISEYKSTYIFTKNNMGFYRIVKANKMDNKLIPEMIYFLN